MPGKLNAKGVGRCVFTGGEEGVIEVRNVITAMWADRTSLNQNINPQARHSNPAEMAQNVATLPRAGVVLGTIITMDIKPGTTEGGQARSGTRLNPVGEGGRRQTDFRVNLVEIVTVSSTALTFIVWRIFPSIKSPKDSGAQMAQETTETTKTNQGENC